MSIYARNQSKQRLIELTKYQYLRKISNNYGQYTRLNYIIDTSTIFPHNVTYTKLYFSLEICKIKIFITSHYATLTACLHFLIRSLRRRSRTVEMSYSHVFLVTANVLQGVLNRSATKKRENEHRVMNSVVMPSLSLSL